MIDKDRIHELVEIFYQKPPFKTFYVNSEDGKEFSKPLGVFISLGITTSMKTLESLRDVLSRTPGIIAKIVKIESHRVSGQFMNRLIQDNPSPFEVSEDTVFPNTVLGETEARQELKILEEMVPEKYDEFVRLRDSISRVIESGSPWENYKVMKIHGGGYRVFHRLVNYQKNGNTEYRIGIYVEETT